MYESKEIPKPAVLTVAEAATYLALSTNMIRKLYYSHELTAVHMGRSVRFLKSDLDAYIMRSRSSESA